MRLAVDRTTAHNGRVLTIDTILRFLKPENSRAFLFWLLPVSMILLTDAYTIILASEQFGAYMVLAVSATVTLLGVLISILSIRRHQRRLRRAVFLSAHPNSMYRIIGASFVSGLLFLGPGAVSALLGALCMLPVFRLIPGYIVTKRFENYLGHVYEHLKMEHVPGVSAFSDAMIQQDKTEPQVDRQPEHAPGAGEQD